jgi:predicted NAD/FAD-binding protein
MNRLQGLDPADPLFVTLNPTDVIDPGRVYDTHTFRHPVFDRAAMAAQAALPEIQGQQNTWFCGAWARNGFHEDGLWSAHQVNDHMLARADETGVAWAAE